MEWLSQHVHSSKKLEKKPFINKLKKKKKKKKSGFPKKYGNKKRPSKVILKQGMNTQNIVPNSTSLNHCLQSLQLKFFCTPICMMRESTISILFKYPFRRGWKGGGGGEGSGGFFAILQKKIYILLFTHDNSIFLTPDEIESGASDLGM